MRLIGLTLLGIGFATGRMMASTPRGPRRSRDGARVLTKPRPRTAATEPAAPAGEAFDLPRWNLRLETTDAGGFQPYTLVQPARGSGVSLLYAAFLSARHDADAMGDALYDFGLRTSGGPDYARLLGELGQANVRLGEGLSDAVLNDSEVQQAANRISATANDLRQAAVKTKLPTSTVVAFDKGISLVNAIASLFKR